MSRFDISKMGAGQGQPQRQKPADFDLIDETEEEVEGDDDLGEQKPKAKPSLDQATQQHLIRLGEQQAFARLTSDPDVMKLLQAKQGGKKVRLQVDDGGGSTVDRGDEPQEQVEQEEVNLEELDNRGLAKHVVGQVSKLLDSKLGSLTRPLQDKISQLDKYAQGQENQRALKLIDDAKQEFPDFEQYTPKMVALSQENPGLEPRELYLLAKLRSGATMKARRMESERPSTSINRPSTSVKIKGLPAGRAGFGQLIEASLNKHRQELEDELGEQA
jgi:hypothetical protein